MDCIFVIDVGTSSMRGILYSPQGCAVFQRQRHYQPEYLEGCRAEMSPSILSDSLVMITREAVCHAKENGYNINAVSLTSQRSSVIPVNDHGQPLYPAIMWQDKRSSAICDGLEKYGSFIYNRTGSKINPVFAAPKMSWLKQNEPEIYRKAFKLLVIPDYLVHFMTGSFVTDYTYGSRTSLMNLETLQWDDEILEIFGLHKSKLCELVDQGRVCGFTTSAFSALTGLAEGTPVVSAGGDQQCAALGAGVIDNGAVQITTGTGSFLLLSSDEIILDPQMQSICNVSSVPGKYVVENSILTTSSIYAWFRNNFYPECASEGDGLDKLNREASASPAGANGLILLPHFRGRGSPDWNPAAKGMFYNVGLDTTRGDFARSILEGIAAEITENLGRLEKLLSVNGGEISNITVGGGLTNFELFNHIQADFINRRLTLSCNREASALGAWVSAAVALGFHQTPYSALKEAEIGIEKHSYEPVEENATIYGNSLVLRKRLYETLSGNGIYNM